MTKICLYLSILFAIVLSVFGCTDTSNMIEVSLGQEFTLDPEQSAALTAGLPLTVEHVLPSRRRI